MTKQESFKKRIRARMAKTGEKYGAARRVLIEQSEGSWVSDPEMSDEAVTSATGKGWDEWRAVIDAGPGAEAGHAAIANHLREEYDVDGWWAQTITVGYERITGLRLPHQQPDGTFTASKTKTVAVDAEELRRMILDDSDRGDLLGGMESSLRSRPTSKSLRVGIPEGIAQFSISAADDGRSTVTVTHEKLDSPEDVNRWKKYWGEWLDALDES